MGTKTRLPGAVFSFLVVLLPFLLCVSPAVGTSKGYKQQSTDSGTVTSSPNTANTPPSFTPFTSTTVRPHCLNPEECCEHPRNSTEFEECCEQHGCCPMSCPVTKPGGIIIPTRECHAWECCAHPVGSQRHQKCCRRNGCCPVCERVSTGCCFNGVQYAFGTMVLDLPEVCLQLVCAGNLLPVPPYFVSTITAVKTCSFAMNECVGCPVHRCVDNDGLVRMEGEKWYPTPCMECQCHEGYVVCMGFLDRCPPPPHPGCITIPGPCCPTYHCEDGCFDENGVFRPVGSTWPSNTDPCEVMLCTEDGIKIESVIILCIPPPQPHKGCTLQPIEGQCCPGWNCSRCLDDDGTYHPLDDEWQSGPCIVKICTATGIVERATICPPLGSPPHDSCYKGIVKGDCCESWKCDGCWDGEILHLPGSQWPSQHPCVNNFCTDDGVVPRPVLCPDFPRPHESCFEHIPEGECCPKWNCSGCVDEDGVYHPLYHEWQADQCTTYVCHLNGITTKGYPCPQLGPAPHPRCYKGLDDTGCCKEWKCNGCIDDAGVFHPPGSTWNSSDPCETFVCLRAGVIDTITEECHLPPTLPGCVLEHIEGQCCPEWNCSGCWDEEGQRFRKYGEEWTSLSDPCTTHLCTRDGIRSDTESCYTPLRPNPKCILVTAPGECCPEWDCKYGPTLYCYDDEGQQRESGEQWPADIPCMVNRCKSGIVVTEPVQCRTEPPADNCIKEHPEGNCCPTWNCSGCLDEEGNWHPNGSTWTSQSGPCRVFRCLNGEIFPVVVRCNTELPPLPICFLSDQLVHCCPTWNCSGCMDDEGEFHALGDSWTSLCAVHICTSEGIVNNTVDCPGPPEPHCVEELPPLNPCCPTWRCDEPIPDCANVRCQGPPWNANCQANTVPGKCCPLYSCKPPIARPDKPECAVAYCQGPPLDAHCTAHVPRDHCCPYYSCRQSDVNIKPSCAAVTCLAAPPNTNCAVTTPPGECCPVLDCK